MGDPRKKFKNTPFDMNSKIYDMETYIKIHFKNKKEFAESQGVKPQQVTNWIRQEFIVIDHVIFSQRRAIVGRLLPAQ